MMHIQNTFILKTRTGSSACSWWGCDAAAETPCILSSDIRPAPASAHPAAGRTTKHTSPRRKHGLLTLEDHNPGEKWKLLSSSPSNSSSSFSSPPSDASPSPQTGGSVSAPSLVSPHPHGARALFLLHLYQMSLLAAAAPDEPHDSKYIIRSTIVNRGEHAHAHARTLVNVCVYTCTQTHTRIYMHIYRRSEIPNC